jgi:hypothetical protein
VSVALSSQATLVVPEIIPPLSLPYDPPPKHIQNQPTCQNDVPSGEFFDEDPDEWFKTIGNFSLDLKYDSNSGSIREASVPKKPKKTVQFPVLLHMSILII